MARAFTGLALLTAGVIIGLYGLLAFLFRHDEGGDSHVTLFGRKMDAGNVGVVSLVLAALCLALAVAALRRPRGKDSRTA